MHTTHQAGHHASKGPDVERIVVLLEINEQLGSFKIARRHTDIVLAPRVIEFREAPIDQTQLRSEQAETRMHEGNRPRASRD